MEELIRRYFHTYYEGLHRYAWTIVRDNDDAEDIVQSVFTSLWEKRNQVDISNSGKSYLFTAVYHQSLNLVRNRKSKTKHLGNYQSLVNEVDSNFVVENKELEMNINKAMQLLPTRCKQVFYMSRYEGKRYAEIADELNISVKTVEVQIGKALKSLKEQLAGILVIVLVFMRM